MKLVAMVAVFVACSLPLLAQEGDRTAEQVQQLISGALDPETLTPEQRNNLLLDLARRLQDHERRLAAMENRVAKLTTVAEATERAALEKLRDIHYKIGAFAFGEARHMIADLVRDFPDTPAAEVAEKKLIPQLDAIGRDAGTLEQVHWFQGSSTMDRGLVTVLIFWEIWCPHCTEELPKIQALYQRYADSGVNLIGVTTAKEEKDRAAIREFLQESHIQFPIAIQKGELSEHFVVTNVPALAVVLKGKLVWRGHPALLGEPFLDRLLEMSALAN